MALRAGSSSVTHRFTYDVFLSFRGEDTRLNFVGHLYESLRQSGIYAFIDDESLQTGEEIAPSLFKAIQESRIAIIVFSRNYASSTFCLDELAKIIECFEGEGRLVYPVFYYVDPSEVRHQRGSYGEALALLQKRLQDKEKLQKWSLALSQAANLSGWHLKPRVAKEQVYIRRITCEVSTKINRIPLHVTNYPVGLVSRVQEVISLLDLWSDKQVNMVGICGIGGIGKSTIARAVYNSIADHFEGLCFLSNVREISRKHGLLYLQETLLSELVREKDLKFGDFYRGISIIEHRLHRKKILLVVDDVDKLEQLRALAGRCDWFGFGSRIIITTRNKHLLVSHGVEKIYDVMELNDEEALQLFSWNAFKMGNMDSSYLDVSNRAILYSCGLPLALEVIGSNLCGKRINEWSSALDEYQRIPNKEVFKVLKLSFDALEDKEKEIFLDLACFFKGEKLGDAISMLLSIRGVQPDYVIGVLIDKSLIKIEEDRVTMHDLVEDMGKEIVRQQSPKEPGKRDRLWFYDDILHVLQENSGTDEVEVIILDLPKDKKVQWNGKAFKKMKNLKMLVIKNACFSRGPKYLPNSLSVLDWRGYPFEYLPSNFHPTKLIHLDLSNSSIELLQPFNKKFESLSCLNFRNCEFLREIPNLSGVSNLIELWLDDCANLTIIHDSVGFLGKLRELSAMRCKSLRTLPSGFKLTTLEHLNFFGCSSLQSFPEILDKMEKIRTLDLDQTAIEELPSSISNLIGLEILNMEECHHLKQLPASICMLPNLWALTANFSNGMRYVKMCEDGEQTSLDYSAVSLTLKYFCFSNCNLSDDSLAICLSYFPNMMHLDLRFNNFKTLPSCIKECHHLKYLLLDNCKLLQHIEGMPPNLEKFSAACCTLLTESSRSIVLNQAFYQHSGKRNFILPGKNIPEWCDKYSLGNSLSFWVRKEFPTIFLWILVKDNQDSLPVHEFSVRVNDSLQEISSGWLSLSTIRAYHIYLSDLRSIVRRIQLSHVDKWNHVKISIKNSAQEMKSKREIYFAIHVYKQENNVENIQFMDPRACIDYCPWKLIQLQPEDWEQVKDDMSQDSNSTNSAELTQNCMSYQDLGTKLCSITKCSETKEGGVSLIGTRINAIEKKIIRWEEEQSMNWEFGPEEASEYLNAVDEARQLIEWLESMHLNKEDQEYKSLLMACNVLQTAMARLEKEFRNLLIQKRHPIELESVSLWSSELDDTIDGRSSTFYLVEESRDSFSRASAEHIIDLIHLEVVSDIRCIANLMFASNYGRECYDVYTIVRRDTLDKCLLHLEKESMSNENVLIMDLDSWKLKVKRWIWQVKIFVRVHLASEKWLSYQIFGDTEISLTCFVGASKASILQLLNFCEAISVGHQPHKLFCFLDMYEVLADLLPDIDALYSDEVGSSVRTECQGVLKRLGDCVKITFLEFKNAIALSSSSSTPSPGGGNHPLTRCVMNYIVHLTNYSNTFNLLLDDGEEEYAISLPPDMSPVIIEDSRIQGSPGVSPVALHFRSVASILDCNLVKVSKLYKEVSLQHLFLMNNIHYMARKVNESKLKNFYGDEWIQECIRKFQQHALNYERASWSFIRSLLNDKGIQISTSKNLLKERLRNFYVAFEDIYRMQTAWIIPDLQLRQDLRTFISLKVVQAYRTFLGRSYSYVRDIQIKYNCDDFETFLLDFFEGSPKSLPNPLGR